MARFFVSDTHFGHANIIDYCDRPFDSVGEMNEALVQRWNDTVAPSDTVYHLGDVALGPWAEWDAVLSRLHGTKILIIGNHDRIFPANKSAQVERFGPVYQQWFDICYTADMVRLQDGTYVYLSHFPYDGDSHDADRYRDFRLLDIGTPLIHGHTHSIDKLSFSDRGTPQIHVGVDAWDYAPVPEDKIIDLLNGNNFPV